MHQLKPVLLPGICALLLSSCAAESPRPLVDPAAVRFPLAEAGALDIEGTVVGQPRAKDGIIYFATREGFLTAVVAPARQVFWRFKADHPVSAGPELSEDHVLFRDDGHVLYVLDPKGALLMKRRAAGTVTTAVREHRGRIYFGTEEGRIQALDSGAPGGSRPAWEYEAPGPVTAGPVFAGELVLFGTSDGRLIALDHAGQPVWQFGGPGPITADPAVAGERIYFGTGDKSFFCVNATTGKKIWSRRLQGAPLHPAHVHGSRVAVAASNSVVYFLSRRGGSILSWELVPSRVVHEPAAAGTVLIISSAAPRLAAIDLKSGKRLGEHLTSGLLSTGALWVSPLVVGFEEDGASGRQKLVFLERRPDPPPAFGEKQRNTTSRSGTTALKRTPR
ncbi:MAG: hypothetical protein FJY79_12185 [Candidatus Aminicenantes bacterium]|nr:hypothetical protein [Candidatus Aminicenantes bacterium]